MGDFSMEQLPDWSRYSKCKEKDELIFDDGTTTDQVHAEFFEQDINGRIISVGVFSHNRQKLFCAWGYKDEEHCAMHAVMGNDGNWSTPERGCPTKVAIKEEDRNIGLQMPATGEDRMFLFSF